MKAACAWCAEERGETPNGETTHGICPRHYDQMMTEIGMIPDIVKRLLDAVMKCGRAATEIEATLKEMRQAIEKTRRMK